MTLIDRYLAEVERRLPAKEARDLMAELRDELLSSLEALEARLGRPAAEGEVADLIRGFGHPRTVAARYRGSQALIGPETYPLFVEVARPVLGVLAAVIVLMFGLPMVTRGADVDGVLHVMFALVDVLLPTFGGLVLVFAALEREGPAKAGWDPRRLPRAAAPRDRRERLVWDLAIGVVVAGWVLGLLPTDWMFRHDGAPIDLRPSPAAEALRDAVLALALTQVALAAAELLRPGWRVILTLANIALGGACLAVAAAALRGGPLVDAIGEGAAVLGLFNAGARVVVWIVAVIVACDIVRDVWSLWRGRRR